MVQPLHAGLAAGRWFELTLMEQLGNIGSEVGRATRAKAQGNEQWPTAGAGQSNGAGIDEGAERWSRGH